MIGIFDSGVGGLCAYRRLRELMPREDIVYLADRRNAPYGRKTPEEILSFTKENIRRLSSYGAEQILIACCSASSVYDRLTSAERQIATPIIRPTARLCRDFKRVAVIATSHTARVGVFKREIGMISQAEVFEMATQELVEMVEGGCRDGKIHRKCKQLLEKIAKWAAEINADALILGCTHFSHLEGEIARLNKNLKIISPARVGAEEIALCHTASREGGRVIYT